MISAIAEKMSNDMQPIQSTTIETYVSGVFNHFIIKSHKMQSLQLVDTIIILSDLIACRQKIVSE